MVLDHPHCSSETPGATGFASALNGVAQMPLAAASADGCLLLAKNTYWKSVYQSAMLTPRGLRRLGLTFLFVMDCLFAKKQFQNLRNNRTPARAG